MSARTRYRVCTPRALTPAQDEAHAEAAAESRAKRGPLPSTTAAVYTSAHWEPGATIRYCFGGGRKADRAAVAKAMAEWSRYANLRFVEVFTDATSDVRIGFDRSLGSWSYLGTQCWAIPKNQATANMGWANDPARDLHEIGHVLGLIHEHSNPLANQGKGLPWNKPVCYRYYGKPPNNWSKAEVDAQVFAVYDQAVLTNGGYDPLSNMHYAFPDKFFTEPGFGTAWNQTLSAGDKTFVAQVYPR